ncbi:transporter, major facilitator family protein [Necator americanus]|uniref:Transporter, major facilitator family protein n=1 Tax=Necator americanus TaxID=51031 RepID=W2T767_NECAM|nr:transporter, major facilitator family protein [Necator americanus]ETN77850.1 transporter, major facilitator family protein [Necator americanus]
MSYQHQLHEEVPSTDPPGERSRASSLIVNYLHLDADKVLSAYGKFGRYQMVTYLITNSVHILFAINMMVMPFITEDPKFECEITPPKGVNWDYTIVDKCTVMDSNNWTLTCSSIPGARYNYSDDKHESLASEFNLVCDNYEAVEHGASVFMLGGMLVAPIITQLSDLFGRRLTFLIPLYVAVVSNLICAVAPNYLVFLVFRFIAGVATTGFSAIGWVLCMESVALEFRSLIPLMGSITWVIGYVAAGVLKLFISNWRWLYFAVSVPGILTIPYYWLTPESLHWLITNKKNKGVSKYIRTSSRFNRVEIPLHECKSSTNLDGEGKKRTFFDIFKCPALVIHLLLNAYILIVMNGTYWALSLFSTELSADKMTGFFLSGIVEIPAGLIAIVLLVYFDRKTVSFLSLTLQALSMICALYLPREDSFNEYDLSGCVRTGVYATPSMTAILPVDPRISMIFPLLAKMSNTIVWCSQPLLYTESTPTSVRNVFCGVAGFMGDLGSVVAPYLKRLEAIHKSAPALVIVVMSLMSAMIVLILPETKTKSCRRIWKILIRDQLSYGDEKSNNASDFDGGQGGSVPSLILPERFSKT